MDSIRRSGAALDLTTIRWIGNVQNNMPHKRDPDPFVRRSQRVLLMVHELHKLGYQELRIMPGMAPSGMWWRCIVTTVKNILKENGAMVRDWDTDTAHYSSSQENVYFGWEDARHDTARQLADKFVERFPAIANRGKGEDWNYAGWYVQMLGFAERGALPVAYADWYSAPDPRWLPTTEGFDSGLPMPPGGEAVAKPEDGDESECLCCQKGQPIDRPRLCPICDHLFKGNGWDGIDGHWRAKHETVLVYEAFWASLCREHKS